MTAEIEEKTKRLVGILERERLDGVVLNAQHNFAWLSAGASNGIDLSRENGAASLLVTVDGRRYLLANNIEMQRLLTEQVSAADFEPVEFSWQDEKIAPSLAVDKAKQIAGELIATDIPLDVKTKAIEGLVARCRYSLTADEVARIRRLGSDASGALDLVSTEVHAGDSEQAVAERMLGRLAAFAITSVVTLVAADERIAAFRHPVPTDKRWARTLLLVTCARRHGLIVSLSRMICRGPIPQELRRKTEAAALVNATLWNATRPGTSGSDLYRIAADAYAAAGYSDEINHHHQGGASGYRTREWVAHPNSNETVQMHQAFAWNPSITGTKIEETVLVTDAGIETLTASSKFPTIRVEIGGVMYHSPGILSV